MFAGRHWRSEGLCDPMPITILFERKSAVCGSMDNRVVCGLFQRHFAHGEHLFD